MDDDGFSHVVYHHRWMINFELIADSFRKAEPSYSDEYVSIFPLGRLAQELLKLSAEKRPTVNEAAPALSVNNGREWQLANCDSLNATDGELDVARFPDAAWRFAM